MKSNIRCRRVKKKCGEKMVQIILWEDENACMSHFGKKTVSYESEERKGLFSYFFLIFYFD